MSLEEEIYKMSIEAVKRGMENTVTAAMMEYQLAKMQIEAQLVAGAMAAPIFHSGLDVREMSKKIGELSASGKSAEEIAKEIDPDEFDGTFFIRPWKTWRVGPHERHPFYFGSEENAGE
jgi:hypothetical protein